MIIGKQFEGMKPKAPDKPLGNAVSTVRKLRARRNRRAMLNMKNNNNFTGGFKTTNLNAPFTYTGQIKNGIPNGKGITELSKPEKKYIDEKSWDVWQAATKNALYEYKQKKGPF